MNTQQLISYEQRARVVLDRINELAGISEISHGITRRYGTDKFLEGRALVENWMKDAGLETRVDSIGNLRGRLRSPNPEAKTLVIASHIDTVKNAGRFDGPLGVIMGLDVLESLRGVKPPFNIDLVAFSDEEGTRFHTTFLGSRVLAGSFDYNALNKTDADGISLGLLIKENGINPDDIVRDAMNKKEWLGYFEMHIEQGPILYENNNPVAVVTSIAGQKRVQMVFKGISSHAGTVPMDMRSDALCCASECVLEIERLGLKYKDNLVATVGMLNVVDGASNVIPGEVHCTLDIRSADHGSLQTAYHHLQEAVLEIANRRNVKLEWEMVQESQSVECDPELNKVLLKSIEQTGHKPLELVSGAGHDAVAISEVAPVSLMFVRCFEGISHNPAEDVELQDITAAIEVAENYVKNLIEKYSN